MAHKFFCEMQCKLRVKSAYITTNMPFRPCIIDELTLHIPHISGAERISAKNYLTALKSTWKLFRFQNWVEQKCINYSYKIKAVSIRSMHIKFHDDNIHKLVPCVSIYSCVDFVCWKIPCELDKLKLKCKQTWASERAGFRSFKI